MRQFSVYENPSERSKRFAPFVVILQSHHLSELETVVVAPLIDDARKPVSLLDIPIVHEGRTLVVAISELANLPARLLRNPVASLAAHEDDIRRALDRLFTGF